MATGRGREVFIWLGMWPTCGLLSPGHYQRVSLSPLSAIADMVAPVVLITLATIFANGLLTIAAVVGERMFALNRERREIPRGPHGEMLDEDRVPPGGRERLSQIRAEEPLIMRRFGRIRNALLIIWITIGLLVLSVAAILSPPRRTRRRSRSWRWRW